METYVSFSGRLDTDILMLSGSNGF